MKELIKVFKKLKGQEYKITFDVVSNENNDVCNLHIYDNKKSKVIIFTNEELIHETKWHDINKKNNKGNLNYETK